MARLFDGSTSKITAANTINLFNNPFSISAWVWGTVCLIGSAQTHELEIQVAGTINIVAQTTVNCASSMSLRNPLKEWHHVIATYTPNNNNPGNTATFYLDGLPWGTGTSSSSANNGIAVNYTVGQASQASEFWKGYISDFAFMKFVINPAQAWALGTGRARPFNIGLSSANYYFYWPMRGGSIEQDYSGNGNNGTLNNTPLAPDPPQLQRYRDTVIDPFRWGPLTVVPDTFANNPELVMM